MLTTATPSRRVHSPQRRRRALEAAGWRTWLSYEENHHRDGSGRMVAVDERWVVELEHVDGTTLTVVGASAPSAWSEAWKRVSRPTTAIARVRHAPTGVASLPI